MGKPRIGAAATHGKQVSPLYLGRCETAEARKISAQGSGFECGSDRTVTQAGGKNPCDRRWKPGGNRYALEAVTRTTEALTLTGCLGGRNFRWLPQCSRTFSNERIRWNLAQTGPL